MVCFVCIDWVLLVNRFVIVCMYVFVLVMLLSVVIDGGVVWFGKKCCVLMV